MARFSVLSELQRKSEDAAIRVKIVSKWNTVGGARPPHCQMILGDEKGSTMEATLPFEVLLPEGNYLEEADWFEIYNFKLISVFEFIRRTRSKYYIKFTATTCFRKIQPLRDSNFLILANFNTILKGLSHPMYYLCRAMVSVGECNNLKN
ncbi:unnamed protein product [Brassica oleracea]